MSACTALLRGVWFIQRLCSVRHTAWEGSFVEPPRANTDASALGKRNLHAGSS